MKKQKGDPKKIVVIDMKESMSKEIKPGFYKIIVLRNTAPTILKRARRGKHELKSK